MVLIGNGVKGVPAISDDGAAARSPKAKIKVVYWAALASAFFRDLIRRFMMVLPQEFKSICYRPCAGRTSSALLASPPARLRSGHKTVGTLAGGVCHESDFFRPTAMVRAIDAKGRYY